jgi:hypothetical protein
VIASAHTTQVCESDDLFLDERVAFSASSLAGSSVAPHETTTFIRENVDRVFRITFGTSLAQRALVEESR